jgi:hypothetical protein
MKLLVTGENLQFLIRIVHTLINFDDTVTIRMKRNSLLLKDINCWNRNVQHKFQPPFFSVLDNSEEEIVLDNSEEESVLDNSEEESETIVKVEHLVECYKMITMLGNTVPHTKCFLEIVQNKLTITMEWRHGLIRSSVATIKFE